MDVRLVDLTAEHAAEAGALLASRHRRERLLCPLLPAGPEDRVISGDLIGGLLEFCEGVGAIDDRGELIGFLTTFEMAPDPTSPAARYAPERAAMHLVHGHAIAVEAHPTVMYAAMFARLAERALRRGVLEHVVHVPIGERATESAWSALGFGRTNVVAVRDLTPITRVAPPGVEVRIATAEELDVVDRLVDEEARFHAASPIFRPYVRAQTRDAVRAQLAADLTRDDRAFLVARSASGDDVGVLSVGPGLGSPLYVPDRAVYIAATAVVPDGRRSGVGSALVQAAFDWARERGHRAACLHFATANTASTAFWTGLGFVPVMAHVRRRLDDRILTRDGS